MGMDYIDYLKKYDNYDKYILYLLALGLNISETSRLARVSRQHIYTIVKENQVIVDDYAMSVKEPLKQAQLEAERTDNEPDTDTRASLA